MYEWVAPDTIPFVGIVRQGNYEPVKKLITPKKRQVISIGGHNKFEKMSINYELTTSNLDLNTFSSTGNNDNIGLAGFVQINTSKKMGTNWALNHNSSLELVQRKFNRIERFRAVEFERNWNVIGVISEKDQLLGKSQLNFLHNKNGKLSYTFNTFLLKDTFSGMKNDVELKWNKNIYADVKGSLLQTNGLKDSRFLRHFSNIYIPIHKFKIGFKDINEENQFFE